MRKVTGYLINGDKAGCTGCEACISICPRSALSISTDNEGFRYPELDKSLCINCGLCHKVCPEENMPQKNTPAEEVFGGFITDESLREQSTSGGAFTAIVEGWSSLYEKYVIFGAVSQGLEVYHSYIFDKALLGAFRKSKYSQSKIRDSYLKVQEFLTQGYAVLFSGTPCQIGGLMKYLSIRRIPLEQLLTVEVVCEGVPSPLYIDKFNQYLIKKKGGEISSIDYRFKDNFKWDFQVMKCDLTSQGNASAEKTFFFKNKNLTWKCDRWFNPFWSIWLNHLMSRPSCYECPYVSIERVADISLGDLWGVHLYCPDLYGNNGGASVVFLNSSKGISIMENAKKYMYGHQLALADAVRYQAPLRNRISMNPLRQQCMADLGNPTTDYETIVKKWSKRSSLKLLFRKYIWGNRQKVALWSLFHYTRKKNDPRQ